MSQNPPGTSVSSYATEAEGGSESESDDEVGAQAPPLTKQISNILNRYPEGGQILKVLALRVTAHDTVKSIFMFYTTISTLKDTQWRAI